LVSYDKFAEIHALYDLTDRNYDSSPEFVVPIAREKASHLRSKRQQLSVIRHELLVSLHTVNKVEKELVDGEWMTWLVDEMYKCDVAAQYIVTVSDDDLEKRMQDIGKLKNYCEDCNRVWGNLKERFTALT
jgi:hypothetical protein